MREKRWTIFCDIDGIVFNDAGSLQNILAGGQFVLGGVKEKFHEWRGLDYYIVLTTARPESARAFTTAQLTKEGLYYDQLVMGLPVGPRVVINDEKPDGMKTAYAACIRRDKGLAHVKVELL